MEQEEGYFALTSGSGNSTWMLLVRIRTAHALDAARPSRGDMM
jgi:hypothetical protein